MKEGKELASPYKKKKWTVVLVISLFLTVSTAAAFFYIRHLENTFLNNIRFYMDEIAIHDTRSVDNEIEKHWEKLEAIANKLRLERYEDLEELQHFLNLEMESSGFETLILIDGDGRTYGANYVIQDAAEEEWAVQFLEEREPFVLQEEMRSLFIVRNNSLLYGVPVHSVTIAGVEFAGIIGRYRIETVKDSLPGEFFEGEGHAQVVGRDGTIITTEITQQGKPLENLLDQLGCEDAKQGADCKSIAGKLAAGEAFDEIFTKDGRTMLLTAKPLEHAGWMVVLTVPYTVAASQTGAFLKITAVFLTVLSAVVGSVFIFAFVSYKRTMILKNSKEIFYREKLFNLLAVHTDDVFAIFDAGTKTLNFISENVERIFGIRPARAQITDFSFLPHTVQGRIEEEEKTAAEDVGGGHLEFEFEWEMPEGKEKKWIHVTVYTVRTDWEEQKRLCRIVVMSDYTQVMENQRKLEAAMEQAQEAAKSKAVFLSNMSHEMRTPLNGVAGCIHLMKNHIDEPAALRDYLNKAEQTSGYLISLINDILDMSKIESHKLMPEERELSYRLVCTNIDTMFRTRMEQKRIRFLVHLEEPLRTVLGDEVRIQQILSNLLGNALKFTDSNGKVSVFVRQEPFKDGQVKTVLTVTDTGMGMSPSFLKKIWLPYEQERTDMARQHGGTGLGLAITHELVELMHGTISVTSKPGEGSTFCVELIQKIVRADEKIKSAAEKMPEEDKCLKGRCLLIAEDNELNREILTTMLEEQGARVTGAENGEKAVELFQASAPDQIDAVLMDMQMPVMDGCTAAKAIRSLERPDAADVIIVACTANAFREDIERVKNAGMDAHMIKPLDMSKLLDCLNGLWEEKGK